MKTINQAAVTDFTVWDYKDCAAEDELDEASQRFLLTCQGGTLRPDVLRNPYLLPELQLEVAQHGDGKDRSALAGNTALVLEVQHLLAQDTHWDVRWLLAGTRGIALSTQELLMLDSELTVKSELAGNASTALSVLKVLVEDGTEDAHVFAAGRNDVSPELFELLLKSPWPGARENLAARANLTPEATEALAHDPNWRVRYALVWNSSVTLTDDFPVACLLGGGPGWEYFKARLGATGADSEVVHVLKNDWTGTLAELFETAQEFTGTPA